jgi:hypothetical protein
MIYLSMHPEFEKLELHVLVDMLADSVRRLTLLKATDCYGDEYSQCRERIVLLQKVIEAKRGSSGFNKHGQDQRNSASA